MNVHSHYALLREINFYMLTGLYICNINDSFSGTNKRNEVHHELWEVISGSEI